MLIYLIFIFPETNFYSSTLERFNEFAKENPDKVIPEQQDAFKIGFVYGRMIFEVPMTLIWALSVSAVLSVLLLLGFNKLKNLSSNNKILPYPLESLKNIGANLILFIFGIFTKRASDQISLYFDVPFRSKIIALFSYALIFTAIGTIYLSQDNINLLSELYLVIVIETLFPIVLIALAFFVKSFKKNYRKKLFWSSLTFLIITWIYSSYIGMMYAETMLSNETGSSAAFTVFSGSSFLINVLIISAFSLYSELTKYAFVEKQSAEAEIKVAQKIQNELIPEIQIQNGFEVYGKTVSAKHVGGDYIDTIKIDKNRTVVAIADVSGHNVAAGLLMSMLKTAFRTELKYTRSPEKLTKSLNQTIYENKNKSMFISLLFGIIDKQENSLTLINAGHPPLLHYSHSDNKIHYYRTGDAALGLLQNSEFKSETIYFSEGDVFILFSDGLMETTNFREKELGIGGIKRKFMELDSFSSAEDIYRGIIKEAESFRGITEQSDDLTLMVIKI
jgi:serine phosphatase RsbU (regulator of sigma subunit)